MVLEIWIKTPLDCESPPLKKPHVLAPWHSSVPTALRQRAPWDHAAT